MINLAWGYIGVTDRDWFDFHSYRKNHEVIFWRHASKPETILDGTVFFFLVKKEDFSSKDQPRMIEGFSIVESRGSGTIASLWKEFGEKLGSESMEALVDSLSQGKYVARDDQVIGYYRLKNVEFLENPLEPEETTIDDNRDRPTYTDHFAGAQFKRNIMTGININPTQTAKLLEKINADNPKSKENG